MQECSSAAFEVFFFPWNDLAVLLSLVLIVNVPICMYVIYRKIHYRCTCRISPCSCHLLYLHNGGILIISGLAWYRTPIVKKHGAEGVTPAWEAIES